MRILLLGTLIGGGIVMAAAMELTSWLVDAGVPGNLLSWAREAIHSRTVFLILLAGVLAITCVPALTTVLIR